MATELATAPLANGAPTPPLSPLDVLTLAEVAAYLRVPEEVVRAEAEGGRLPGRKLLGEWRFVRDGIAAWLRPPGRPLPAPEFVETPEEFEAFLAILRANREADDRTHGFGRYAPE